MKVIENVWRPEVIAASAEKAALALSRTAVLTGFYLAGGTGLALHLGHRRSQDLDFFRAEPFSEEDLAQAAREAGEFTVVSKAPHTLHIVMGGVKVSFLGYNYPLLFPLQEFLGMQIADPRDIACMKLSAVAGRGTKRDFVDLYAAAIRFDLGQIFDWFDKKFAGSVVNRVHLRKSLLYFQDAEKDPMPDMLLTLSWEEVKRFFLAEVPRL
jgi:hypothetical protein